MPPARALPVLALAAAALAAAACAAPASSGRPNKPHKQHNNNNHNIENTNSSLVDAVKYPEGWQGGERPDGGAGSARIFSQLVAPLVQFVVNQLLQAANLVGALAGAGRPNAVLTLFSTFIGQASGGGRLPEAARAPATLP